MAAGALDHIVGRGETAAATFADELILRLRVGRGSLMDHDRRAIREILLATKKNLPVYWK